MADIVGICQEMDREVTLGVLGPILVKKHQPKGACVRRRAAETRHSFLGGSLHEQSGSYWSYLEVPMDFNYVGRRLYAAVGQRKYAEARGSEKRNSALYNYKPSLK